eukprot:7354571-Pyramimonas_sp.AAC.1
MMTWNTRALLHHKPDVRRRKAAKLKQFCSGAGVVALQEVHGTRPDVLKLLCGHQISAACFSSLPAHDAGGVVTLLPQMTQAEADEAVREERIRISELVPGRVLRFAVKARADDERPGAMSVIHNVRNFGLTAQQAPTMSS